MSWLTGYFLNATVESVAAGSGRSFVEARSWLISGG
ncbi:MAG: hypothetical protein QOH68_597 [Nocardioidaceae bacterium]|nr:hypothetical protein [Nocardioidaceae bacterium]